MKFLFVILLSLVLLTFSFNKTNLLEHMKENMFYAYSSYCPENKVRQWNCYWCQKTPNKITLERYIIHPKDNSVACYVGHNERNIYLIFRGTRLTNIETWITNLRVTTEKNWPENVPGSHVHKGFFDAYSEISNQILEAVRRLAPLGKRILILGHSRGGSLGALAAVHLTNNGFNGKIDFMAYGMPRLGNEVFSKYFTTVSERQILKILDSPKFFPYRT